MTAELLSAADLDRAATIVQAGGVVAIPTDTVYGLACHPDDGEAADRIFAAKERPTALELSLLAATAGDATRFGEIAGAAARLAAAFWPGPLSLVVEASPPKHAAIARHTTTVMLRVPDHDLLRDLLRRTGPLATTSANRHGRPPCSTAAEVLAALGDAVDGVLDGGPAAGRPSTIIDCSVTPPRVLRPGPLGEAELRPYLEGPQ
jgi:L-threonylcarbamoyladenylate synthase